MVIIFFLIQVDCYIGFIETLCEVGMETFKFSYEVVECRSGEIVMGVRS